MWRNIQGWQLVILLIIVIVVFGAARLPNAARSLGKSLKIFKSEVSDLREDDAENSGNSEHSDSSASGDGSAQGSKSQVDPRGEKDSGSSSSGPSA